jgi:spore maturation protein CgeB
MGRGGFTIFPEIKGLKNEFPDIVTYKQCDLQDLKKKIDYYLEHDIERSSIQIKLFDFIRDNYTYEQRCQKILQILEQNRGGIIG